MEHFGIGEGRKGRLSSLDHLLQTLLTSYANTLPGGALEVLADIASKVLSHAVSA